MKKKLTVSALAAATMLLVSAGGAWALTITASGINPSSGHALDATADFTQSGNTLTVTLANSSTADVTVQTDVLTALFFSANETLTPGSAYLSSGSTVYEGSTNLGIVNGGDIGGEWGYKAGLSGSLPQGATQGISSTGLGLFSSSDRFGTTNLQGPDSLDGVQYGITSAGDDHTTGNTKIETSDLIFNSALFTFTVSNNFDINSISNVSFQYGTALDEPNIPNTPTPEPATMLLFGSGLVGLAGASRRRKKNKNC